MEKPGKLYHANAKIGTIAYENERQVVARKDGGKAKAVRIIWDYMPVGHRLRKADAIFVLGNRDTRVAEYAAQLYLDGWAPRIVFSGSGSIHNHKAGRERFVGSTEAEVFATHSIQNGRSKAGDPYRK